MSESKITDRIIHFTDSLVGHVRGGFAQVNVISSMFFAGISGAALADVAGLGSVFIPAMEKNGYDLASEIDVKEFKVTIEMLKKK